MYFWNKTLHVSDSPSVHDQEFFTVQTAVVYVMQVCWQLACRIMTETVRSWSCSQAVSKPVWYIALLCVHWKTPDDGQRNCQKHVEFYSKNKFEKLVHIVGFIIRIREGCHELLSLRFIPTLCIYCGRERGPSVTEYAFFQTSASWTGQLDGFIPSGTSTVEFHTWSTEFSTHSYQ